MRRSWQSGIAALAVAIPASVAAQGAADKTGSRANQLIAQKERLVSSLLADSPAVSRIRGSGHAEAIALLHAAGEALSQARLAAGKGHWNDADSRLNDAMWSVGRARQLVPDAASRQIEERVRYARLLDSVESLRASYARHLRRARALPQGVDAGDAVLSHASSSIEEAASLANAEKPGDAVVVLQKAERELLRGLNRVLGATTLDYAQRFETEAEEFAYELERNRAFAELVPLALAELKPAPEAARLVSRYIDQNQTLREQAQREARERNFKAALQSLRSGTGYVQRALVSAGLVMPPEATVERPE